MAAQSKARICGRLLAGTVDCECSVLSGRGLCDGPITRPEESYRVWCVWVRPWSLDNEETLAHQGLLCHGKCVLIIINMCKSLIWRIIILHIKDLRIATCWVFGWPSDSAARRLCALSAIAVCYNNTLYWHLVLLLTDVPQLYTVILLLYTTVHSNIITVHNWTH